ncbi:MAG: LamG domain-containing protein [Butyrivibrio sp.]|nr:LamG domain-containing protein [Butyrivibrio sp.]
MKNKKLLSLLLSSAMAVGILAGCGSETNQTAETAPDTAQSTEQTEAASAEAVTASEIPQDYKYYFSMDGGEEGVKTAVRDTNATPMIQTTDDEVIYIPGVKGNAAYTDGNKGLKLDINGVGDAYTVSFWVYAARNAQYMPTLQYGPDMHGDATGGQHYVNFTWANWNPASEDLSYPSLWAYDQNADGSPWPNWYTDEVNAHTREWVNVTMTVDPANVSADGTMLVADLYLNGEKLVGTDADGNERPVNIVKGSMEASDNFDFLLGINYWDSIMKGAFDEVYVYDYALDASQVKALYEAGDTTVAYEEPAHEFTVYADETAIDSIGSTDLSLEADSDWSEGFELANGANKVVTLRNFSDAADSADNFAIGFVDAANEAHKDPMATATKQYAIVRADAYAETPDANSTDNADKFETYYSWGNWNTWLQQVMRETDVTLNISRADNIITVDAVMVDYNGTENQMTMKVTADITAEDPCYFYITGQKCYIDILSVEDPFSIEPAANAIETIGDISLTNAWWTDWTEAYEIKDGETKAVRFNNYSDGINNWDNYVVMFTNEYTPAHENPNSDGSGSADHVEYAAVRADAYGWDDTFTQTYETSWGDDWTTWLKSMRNATVNMLITRDGGNIIMDATIVDSNGVSYTNKTTLESSLTATDPIYFLITCEECYIELLSVENYVESVGAADFSNAWWTDWSTPIEITEGKKTVTLNNYSDGVNNWDNYVLVFTNEETPAHENPNSDGSGSADHIEYAAVRADAFGWDDTFAQTYETSWGEDWATWLAAMKDAKVTLTIERKAGDITIDANIEGADGETYTSKTTMTSSLSATDPVYMLITCEECLVEVLSVE